MSEYLERPQARLLRDKGDVRLRDLRPLVPLVGIPWDWSTAGRPGARFAPATIRSELYQLSTLSEVLGQLEQGLDDLGDVRVVGSDPLRTGERVKAVASYALDLATSRGVPAVFLGGDHAITGWISLIAARHGVKLLVLDAHYDLRSLEEGVTSGSWLAELKSRLRDLEVLVVGVSEYVNPPYAPSRAKELGVQTVSRVELLDDPEGSLARVRRFAERSKLYVSIDMDHLDQAFAPGVNSPNALGMTPYESLKVLREAVRASSRLVAVDVTEVVPQLDPQGLTARLAAKLVLESVHLDLSRSLSPAGT